MQHFRLFLFLISINLFVQTVLGQDIMVPLSRVPSPQATDLGRFGNIPMSYYTGRANITVPICSFTERGVTLDINLSYDTSGLLMNKLPGWVGPGWTLNAGGCITRVQRYMCDEVTLLTHPSNFVNYFHAYHEVAPNGVIDSATVVNIANWGHKDYAPDVFYFNFMGKTGRFFLGNDGEWKVCSEDNLVVEFNVNNQYNYLSPVFQNFPAGAGYPEPNTIKGFVIYDDQGNKYTFGGETNSIEYSIGFFKTWVQEDDDPWKADCWYLKKVEDRFGNLLYSFSYRRGCYCLQMFRDPTNQNQYTGTLNLPIYLTGISTLSGDQVDFSFSSPCAKGQVSRMLYPSLYPNSVPQQVFPNGVTYQHYPWYYLLKKDENTSPFFATPSANPGDPLSAIDIERLNTIRISRGQSSLQEKYSLNYNNEGRYHLTSVGIKSGTDSIGTYTFTYNDFQAIPADYLTKMHDSGGYFNNSEYSYTPNLEHAKKGMMTKITYPTGGYSTFDYELNDYGCIMTLDREAVVDTTGSHCGLRICDISDYADSPSSVIRRIVKYNNPSTGISSGQLFVDPDDDKYYFIYQRTYNFAHSVPTIPLCTSLNTYVGYSVVTDSVVDGSSHIYCFTNFANRGWAPPAGITPVNNNMEVGNTDSYFRQDFMRGKTAVEYIRDENQVIQKSIRYEYRTDAANYLHQKSYGFDPTYHDNIYHRGGFYTLYYPKYDLQRIATSTKYSNGWVNDTTIYTMTEFNDSIAFLQPPYFRKCTEERTVRIGGKVQSNYSYASMPTNLYFIPKVSTTSKYNDEIQLSENVVYDFFNGTYLPKYELQTVGQGIPDTLITYHAYTSTKLPQSYTRTGEYPTRLYWNSQGRLMASVTCPPDLASQITPYSSPTDPKLVLRINGQSIFNYPEVNATTYIYDDRGNIAASATANGFTQYYLYDDFGRLTEIQDADHHTIQRYKYNYKTSGINLPDPITI